MGEDRKCIQVLWPTIAYTVEKTEPLFVAKGKGRLRRVGKALTKQRPVQEYLLALLRGRRFGQVDDVSISV